MDFKKDILKWKNKFPSISGSLLLFYISLLGGWGDRLLPPRVVDYLEESRSAQVLMTYILIIFSIELFGSKVTNVLNSFLYAFIILILYIIITKQSNIYFFISIALLFTIYFVNKQKNLIKENIKKSTKKRENKLELIENILIVITCIVVVLGFSKYFLKQYKAHRSKSSNIFMFLLKFFLEGSNRVYGKSSRVFK